MSTRISASIRAVAGAVVRAASLMRPVRVPGIPRLPGLLALMALREPRLVPPLVKWRTASRGLGLVVSRLVLPGTTVGAALEGIGEEQGRALREQLGYGRDPTEVARAVALANRLFDIRARLEEVSEEEAWVVTPGCPWSREEWWGPVPCGAFSRYEVGLARGLNPRVRLRYQEKRTRGDARCVGVYSWREASVADDDVESCGDHRDDDGRQHRPHEA